MPVQLARRVCYLELGYSRRVACQAHQICRATQEDQGGVLMQGWGLGNEMCERRGRSKSAICDPSKANMV